MKKLGLVLSTLIAFANLSLAAEVKRYPLPNNSTFPIAAAVEIKGGSLVFESGKVPSPIDPHAKPGSPEFWGNTEQQTDSVLTQIEASLQSKGLDMSNIIKMTVFLVGDPAMSNKMDFAGFMKSYTRYFGTKEQPNLPSRSAVEVAGLAGAGMLVEIEVIAFRP
ncbi:RidA family protein [Paraglaciecola sp.]|uniref:RidA family protein n=1 Tax=Paraglaciecola sp. TaxID=1920173 RepID=UPI0030F46E71